MNHVKENLGCLLVFQILPTCCISSFLVGQAALWRVIFMNNLVGRLLRGDYRALNSCLSCLSSRFNWTGLNDYETLWHFQNLINLKMGIGGIVPNMETPSWTRKMLVFVAGISVTLSSVDVMPTQTFRQVQLFQRNATVVSGNNIVAAHLAHEVKLNHFVPCSRVKHLLCVRKWPGQMISIMVVSNFRWISAAQISNVFI